MTLVVSEVFGPTWQGEGPSVGRTAAFVRLGRCNLACT
ncbi:MAG: 7-carboxy-7-deazaguanine synthase QueE, partial [Actinomycetota bacterium]|nr:7-carboxy-7-deazaguanine synthase QueE [Actinomycetota bacterium]